MAIGNLDSWVYQIIGIPKATTSSSMGAPYQKTKCTSNSIKVEGTEQNQNQKKDLYIYQFKTVS